MTAQYAEYLKDLIIQAGYSNRLKPVVSIEEVEQFEKDFNKQVPNEYKFFLTQVSNGSIGPMYRDLFSLEQLREVNIPNKFDENLPYSQPLSSLVHICDLEEFYPQEYDELLAQDNLLASRQSNLLIIGDRGYSYWQTVIMLGEGEENQIMYLDHLNFCQIINFHKPIGTQETNFLDWYQRLLKELISRNNIDNYGNHYLKSEAEIKQEFVTAESTEQKQNLLYSLDRLPKLTIDTLDFLYALIDDRSIAEIVIQIFLDSYKRPEAVNFSYGIRAFEYVLNHNPSAAIKNIIWLPSAECEKYYDKFVDLLYSTFYNSEELIRYTFIGIEKCSQKQTADIINFAIHKNDDEVFAAIRYYMKDCHDYEEYKAFVDSKLESEYAHLSL
ncbi:MAG: hypothetical protein ATN33_01460 [Epulopiscium sp. Nele67-Bin001]|nr:MAG: hypothetical protein ATN33_01460 [Epulopiscium sp. Nele67-Bin001]